jgi:uncharacterized repeat protein (TIGR01451 family)
MRKIYILGGLAVFGMIGLIGWARLSQAQPSPLSAPGVAPNIIEPVGLQPDEAPATPLTPALPKRSSPPLAAPPSAGPIPPPDEFQPGRFDGRPKTVPEFPPALELPPSQDVAPTSPSLTPERPKAISINASKPPAHPEQIISATEPAVSMEWTGPTALRLGATAIYTLAVRNTANIPIQKVVVQARMPAGMTIVASEPKAEGADGVLLWEIGNMLAKQERRFAIKVMAPRHGDLNCQAWVTFTGSSVMKVRVREPKLQVKLHAPETIVIGEPANLVLSVSNPGDHPAEHVKITAMISEGLESIRGNKVHYDLGALAPGESRSITVPCISKLAGPQRCEASAEGDDGLTASDRIALNVIQPRLELAMSGPKLRYLDKKAVYVLKVTNPGDAPAANVFVTEIVPSGFKYVQADNGGQLDDTTNSVKWFVGELAPGQSKEVKCELLAASPGEFTHRAIADASRGMKAEQELKTSVEGLSAILMEVIDTEDPVEIGSDTAYEIKVTNTGSKAETDVKLICTVPPQLRLKAVTAPMKYQVVGNDVIFAPLPRLAPRADVVFKITVTAQAKGDARFKAALTTASLIEPVIKVEPTKVYGD